MRDYFFLVKILRGFLLIEIKIKPRHKIRRRITAELRQKILSIFLFFASRKIRVL